MISFVFLLSHCIYIHTHTLLLLFTVSYRDHRNPRSSSFTAMTIEGGHTTHANHTNGHTSLTASNHQMPGHVSTSTITNLRSGSEDHEIMDEDGEASPILPPTTSSPTTNGGSNGGVTINGNNSNEKTIRSYGSTD